ncbi:hypothetical protein MRX96_050217 [Rhipicephalus microplus]
MSQAAVQNDLLISLVHEQRVLWDQRLAAYKNIDARTAAWIAVETSLGLAGTQGEYHVTGFLSGGQDARLCVEVRWLGKPLSSHPFDATPLQPAGRNARPTTNSSEEALHFLKTRQGRPALPMPSAL